MSEFDFPSANASAMVVYRDPSSYSFEVGDMVWGKVKSHPWWPGQVYDEAFAMPSVRRTKREGSMLVAFFGDSSYGWFYPSELAPYDDNFEEKTHQTSAKNFLKAVEESVDEVGRRSALGLVCKCRNPNRIRSSNVSGFSVVDVPDYEPSVVYSWNQIREARNRFSPIEILCFVKSVASTPLAIKQGTIEFIKNKAAVMALRKETFEEFDETYAEAFGVLPAKSSSGALVLDQPTKQPTLAPLSGPLVVAEESKGINISCKKAARMKGRAEKDRFLFKRRDDIAETMPQPVQTSDTSVYDLVLQKRVENSITGSISGTFPASLERVTAHPGKEREVGDAANHVVTGGFDFSSKGVPVDERRDLDCEIASSYSLTPVKRNMIDHGGADKGHTKKTKARASSGIRPKFLKDSSPGISGPPMEKMGPPEAMYMSVHTDSWRTSGTVGSGDGGRGTPVFTGAPHLAETRRFDERLVKLLAYLRRLALDPLYNDGTVFHCAARQAFSRFRSLVYVKSLPLPIPNEADADVRAAIPSSPEEGSESSEGGGVEEVGLGQPRLLGGPHDPMKIGKKRSPSERQGDILARKVKKINDLKSLVADKKSGKEAEAAVMAPKSRKSTPIKSIPKPGPQRKLEPASLLMKFPRATYLPSIPELKARFVRFGPLDQTVIRVYWTSSTCRVGFKYKEDAHAAYRYATANTLFGSTDVKYKVREEGKLMADAPDPFMANNPGPSQNWPPPPSTAQPPKSILKKPTGEETDRGSGGNGRRVMRVKFALCEDEFKSRQFDSDENPLKNENWPPPNQFHKHSLSQIPFPEAAPLSKRGINQSAVITNTSGIDVSQEMLKLLTICNDIVTAATGVWGYLPYRPL